MRLDVASMLSNGIFQLALGRIKGIAQRNVHVLIVIMGNDDFFARHAKVKPHTKLATLMPVFAQFLDAHTATGHVRMKLL